MYVVSECRSCGSDRLVRVLSLGWAPLANALRSADGSGEVRYPLDLLLCEMCTLAQLSVTVLPRKMFADYPYFSSVSSSLVKHAGELAKSIMKSGALRPNSFVVEIGSNDGYLLKHFKAVGMRVQGIEAASNVAEAARREGIPTENVFFDSVVADRVVTQFGKVDLILANNVMAHMPDINDVVSGIAAMLSPSGTFVMETPYARCMLDGLQYDTIYHEHVFYYSCAALAALFKRHGLCIVRSEVVPIHGGSLRVFAERVSGAEKDDDGDDFGSEDPTRADYAQFAGRVEDLRGSLRTVLAGLSKLGARVAAYGAAAKGAMLLHSLGDAASMIEYVVDKSPHKQGRYMPGSGLRVFAPSRLLETRPDFTLLLPWNFEQEIVQEQAEYLRQGGRFIVPVPYPRLVGAEAL